MSQKHQYLPEAHEEPDSWHRHSAAEGTPQHEHAATVNIIGASIGLIAITAFVALVIGLTWMYFNFYTNRLVKNVGETGAVTAIAADYNALRSAAEQRLASYSWVDPKTETVAIPIDQAMQRVVAKYGGGSPSGMTPAGESVVAKEGDGR